MDKNTHTYYLFFPTHTYYLFFPTHTNYLFFPSFQEDCHLRSYAGDDVGRGSGVYDCASDFFFPYVLRGEWTSMAKTATAVRRRANPAYVCEPPSSTAVCVIHLDVPFPYDTYGECRK